MKQTIIDLIPSLSQTDLQELIQLLEVERYARRKNKPLKSAKRTFKITPLVQALQGTFKYTSQADYETELERLLSHKYLD